MATLLLLEDNAPFRAILQEALEVAGHTVVAVPDGSHLAAMLRARTFDLVITDLVMPNRDGIETIMALRKSHPALPVIAMSGDASTHARLYLTIAAKLGAVHTLHKPFPPERLHAAIRDALESGSGSTAHS